MQEIPVVLIGHKDHGKSTLIGRLLFETHSIKKTRFKEVQEVDQAWGRKFELAHLVDSFQEERDNEMTMDTTRAVLKGKKRNYQLIDVPGHGELITNMLSGASNAEVALLLVAIDEGIKEQTKQHLEIAHLLGIKQLGIIVNKIDTIKYKKDLFDGLKKNLQSVIKKIGYKPENIYFFPTSALKGDNIVKKSARTKWYSGPTVMKFIETKIKSPASLANFPLLFLVQDSWINNNQKIITGKIETGKIKIGDKIKIMPDKKQVVVAEIKDFDKKLVKAKAGENIGLVLQNKKNIKRGSVIVSTKNAFEVKKNITGKIFWIKIPSQRQITVECGTDQAKGIITNLRTASEGRISSHKISLGKSMVFDTSKKTILNKVAIKESGQIIGVGNIVK